MGTSRDPRKPRGASRGGAEALRSRDVARVRMNISNTMDEADVLGVELDVLKREHRELDEAIRALEAEGSRDMLTIRRKKKEKLILKDRIRLIEDRLLPDIIA